MQSALVAEVPPNTTSVPALGVPASSTSSGRKDGATGQDHDDEDGMQHLEQVSFAFVTLHQVSCEKYWEV